MNKLYQEAKNLVDKAERILIISHRKPDADTLGAALSLKIFLSGKGKQITLACIDKPSRDFKFLPYLDQYVKEFDLNVYDLMIIVDAGASYMTDFHLKYPEFFKSKVPILNIDHHASNDNFGKINIVDPGAASTTVILYRMFCEWKVEINVQIATCLLAGIYGDTGSFMHSNTDKEVFKIASVLMKKGANISEVSKTLFNTKPVSTLKLWGRVLEKANITEDNIVISVIRDLDYKAMGSNPEQLSGVIDYLNMVPETKFAVLLHEDRKGHVKGSFRTRQNNIDLSRVAAVFGGGGHPKASGFEIPGKLNEEVRYTIVSKDMSKKFLEF